MAPTCAPQVLAAVPTPFDAEGKVDLQACRTLFDHLARTDLDGLFINGTAGEFAAMDRGERRLVTECAAQAVPEGKRLVVHVGAASVHEVLGLLSDARDLGVRDVAVITPYFLPAERRALHEFYRRVAQAADGLRVYVYLYRQVTGNSIDERLLARIAELPNIVGAKISGESPSRIARYVASCPPGFAVYAGADQELTAMVERGARGVVSAMSSAIPGPFTRLAAALAAGDGWGVAQAQAQVDDICAVLDGNPARIKAALRLRGVAAGHPRMAIAQPNAATEAEIRRIVDLYGEP